MNLVVDKARNQTDVDSHNFQGQTLWGKDTSNWAEQEGKPHTVENEAPLELMSN